MADNAPLDVSASDRDPDARAWEDDDGTQVVGWLMVGLVVGCLVGVALAALAGIDQAARAALEAGIGR